MKHSVLTMVALLALLAVPLGCTPQNTPSVTTTTTSESTTTTTLESSPSHETTTTVKSVSTAKSTTTVTTAADKTTATSTVTKPQTTTTKTTAATSTSATTNKKTTTATTTTTTKTVASEILSPSQSTSSSRRTVSTKSRTTTTTPTTVYDPNNPFAISYPITPSMSIEDSSKRIHNNVKPTKKLDSDVVQITDFDPEYAFAHHPGGFEYFKGKFYAAFSRGYTGEDMPGQQAVLCTSEDFYHWSEPQVIVPATQGAYGETCVGPGPMYVAGGKLFYTYGVSDYSKEYFDANGNFNPRAKGTRTDTMYRIYTEDGVTWSKPQRISSIGMNYYLRKNLTGRWMSCYGSWLHRSDAEIPDGVTWNYYVMPTEMRNNSQKRNGGTLHERSWYQSLDGVVHLMIRSDKGYLWNAESYDNGESFTEFYPTNFSSKNTQFNFYNLPDGRPIAVGSPASSTSVWDMWPLNLYVSNDGYNFDTAYILRDERYTMRQTGYSKGGEYAYMKFLVHDGYFYVFYSKMKEVMEVTRVKISDLKS